MNSAFVERILREARREPDVSAAELCLIRRLAENFANEYWQTIGPEEKEQIKDSWGEDGIPPHIPLIELFYAQLQLHGLRLARVERWIREDMQVMRDTLEERKRQAEK